MSISEQETLKSQLKMSWELQIGIDGHVHTQCLCTRGRATRYVVVVVMTDLVGALWLRDVVDGWWVPGMTVEPPVRGVMGSVIGRAVLRDMWWVG
jgi:hypothetical protein